jgi:hypothetical protein
MLCVKATGRGALVPPAARAEHSTKSVSMTHKLGWITLKQSQQLMKVTNWEKIYGNAIYGIDVGIAMQQRMILVNPAAMVERERRVVQEALSLNDDVAGLADPLLENPDYTVSLLNEWSDKVAGEVSCLQLVPLIDYKVYTKGGNVYKEGRVVLQRDDKLTTKKTESEIADEAKRAAAPTFAVTRRQLRVVPNAMLALQIAAFNHLTDQMGRKVLPILSILRKKITARVGATDELEFIQSQSWKDLMDMNAVYFFHNLYQIERNKESGGRDLWYLTYLRNELLESIRAILPQLKAQWTVYSRPGREDERTYNVAYWHLMAMGKLRVQGFVTTDYLYQRAKVRGAVGSVWAIVGGLKWKPFNYANLENTGALDL